jgi:ribosomal protein S18 acetylase RimI-like enzyme
MSHTAHAVEAARTWTRDGFLVSTDSSLIPIDALNKAFASEALYWASPLPDPVMQDMLDNCLCFGLYSPTPAPPAPSLADQAVSASTPPDPAETMHEIAGHVKPESSSQPQPSSHQVPSKNMEQRQTQDQEQPSLIGFARLITDRVTFAYLTDVYTLPEWQGQGLGKWLISCVQEVVEDMPYLRRSMCIIGHGREKALEFYGNLMKMTPLKEPVLALVCCLLFRNAGICSVAPPTLS